MVQTRKRTREGKSSKNWTIPLPESLLFLVFDLLNISEVLNVFSVCRYLRDVLPTYPLRQPVTVYKISHVPEKFRPIVRTLIVGKCPSINFKYWTQLESVKLDGYIQLPNVAPRPAKLLSLHLSNTIESLEVFGQSVFPTLRDLKITCGSDSYEYISMINEDFHPVHNPNLYLHEVETFVNFNTQFPALRHIILHEAFAVDPVELIKQNTIVSFKGNLIGDFDMAAAHGVAESLVDLSIDMLSSEISQHILNLFPMLFPRLKKLSIFMYSGDPRIASIVLPQFDNDVTFTIQLKFHSDIPLQRYIT
jgi:hypothetical protein